MKIQSIERTFIDKIFAICDYHLHGTYERFSRHIYDLHMIWNSNILDINKVNECVDKVIVERQKNSKINLSCKNGSNPKEVLEEIIELEVFKRDFNEVTITFLHKRVSYEECISSLEAIIQSNIIPEYIHELVR